MSGRAGAAAAGPPSQLPGPRPAGEVEPRGTEPRGTEPRGTEPCGTEPGEPGQGGSERGEGGPQRNEGGPERGGGLAPGVGRAGGQWALPRRRPPRRRPRLWALRAPIPRPAYATLVALSVLAPLAGWLLLSASGQVNPRWLPSVPSVWSAGVEMAASGQLLADVWASVRRVLIGFGLAVAVSAPLGLLVGSFRAGQALLEPAMGLLRYLPAAAFVPLLMLYLGLDEAPKIALLFIGTVFFNTLMSADAVRQVPAPLIDVSYTLGARRGEVLRKVVIPYALPGMIDAIRVNAAAAWNLVMVAELIAAEAGLGYRIARSARFIQTDKIFAVLVVIALIGLATDVLLRSLRDRSGRWVT